MFIIYTPYLQYYHAGIENDFEGIFGNHIASRILNHVLGQDHLLKKKINAVPLEYDKRIGYYNKQW